MVKKAISRELLMTQINYLSKDDIRNDYDRYFTLKGGRGFIMIFNRLFNEQINILGNGLSFSPSLVQKSEESGLDIGYKTTRIFIAGIGFLTVEHDNQFDVYTAGGELYAGLPERSYCGALLLDDKTLGILDLLVNSPYQDISDWVKAFSSFIDETKLSLDKFKKELSNLEIDNLF